MPGQRSSKQRPRSEIAGRACSGSVFPDGRPSSFGRIVPGPKTFRQAACFQRARRPAVRPDRTLQSPLISVRRGSSALFRGLADNDDRIRQRVENALVESRHRRVDIVEDER